MTEMVSLLQRLHVIIYVYFGLMATSEHRVVNTFEKKQDPHIE